jgi:hypothetical protein
MIKTIVMKVTFIGEGDSKEIVRILEPSGQGVESKYFAPMPTIEEFKVQIDEWIDSRFDFDVTTPGTSD